METHCNGPPAELRPHVRQRRLNMGRVNASVERHAAMKAEQSRNEELAFANIRLHADRQRRGDDALDLLASLVAALLCPEFTPNFEEPVSEFPAGRTNNRERCEHAKCE